MRRADNNPNPIFYAIIAVLILMSLGPILLMISTSFQENVQITSDDFSLFDMFVNGTLKNYETVLCNVLWYEPAHVDYCDPAFGRSLANSLIIALLSTGITLVTGCMAAYALVRFKFMGRGTVSMTTLIVRMVPPAVLLVPVFGIWTFQFSVRWYVYGYYSDLRCDELAVCDLDFAELYCAGTYSA